MNYMFNWNNLDLKTIDKWKINKFEITFFQIKLSNNILVLRNMGIEENILNINYIKVILMYVITTERKIKKEKKN